VSSVPCNVMCSEKLHKNCAVKFPRNRIAGLDLDVPKPVVLLLRQSYLQSEPALFSYLIEQGLPTRQCREPHFRRQQLSKAISYSCAHRLISIFSTTYSCEYSMLNVKIHIQSRI
jgi:hypothetical protein